MRVLFTFLFLVPVFAYSQKDTIITVYGKDHRGKGFCDTCVVSVTRYVDDRREGTGIRYYPNGQVKFRINFQNGRPYGAFEKYYENGQLKERGIKKNGRHYDILEKYYPSGCPKFEGYFNEDGKEEGLIRYYYDGCDSSFTRLEMEYNAVDGVPVGHGIRFYPNGDIQELLQFGKEGEVVKKQAFDRENDPFKQPWMREDPNEILAYQGGVEDGEVRVFNDLEDIHIEGEVRDGKLWNGKVYVYDTDGILLKVKLYRNGKFTGEAHL